jgi:hypothetical protein
MIHYNIRYRGPYEYDKLLISILQLSNEVKYSTKQTTDGEFSVLGNSDKKIKNMFEQLTGEDGLLNHFLKLKLKIEGDINE